MGTTSPPTMPSDLSPLPTTTTSWTRPKSHLPTSPVLILTDTTTPLAPPPLSKTQSRLLHDRSNTQRRLENLLNTCTRRTTFLSFICHRSTERNVSLLGNKSKSLMNQ